MCISTVGDFAAHKILGAASHGLARSRSGFRVRGGPAGRGGRAATTDLVHVVDVCATAQPHEYQWSVSNTAFLYMHSTTTYCRVDLFDHMDELVTNALRTRYKLVHMNEHVISTNLIHVDVSAAAPSQLYRWSSGNAAFVFMHSTA